MTLSKTLGSVLFVDDDEIEILTSYGPFRKTAVEEQE